MNSRTVTVERLNDTPAQSNFTASLMLDHIHATLDLLHQVTTLSNGANGDIGNLCVGTLSAAIDGLMREVAEVQAYVDGMTFPEGGQ